MTLEGTINPMRQHLAYREIENLPLAERQAKLRDSKFRQRILSEQKVLPRSKDAVRMMNNYDTIWVMDEAMSYEPSHVDSVSSIAAARNLDPLEVVMDTMAEGIDVGALWQVRR